MYGGKREWKRESGAWQVVKVMAEKAKSKRGQCKGEVKEKTVKRGQRVGRMR